MEHNFKWKNDGRTKVMIGCGTRPEIIRLAAVIKRCREYFDCCVVYYNQNWDRNLSTVFWEDFELKNTFGEYGPDILVPVVGENLGVTCGNIMGRSYGSDFRRRYVPIGEHCTATGRLQGRGQSHCRPYGRTGEQVFKS